MSYSRSKSLARRLPPLPQISDIIQLYNLSAKSQLSQNFLLDLNITDKLVKVAGRVQGCCVCEVGPGPGSLTRSILNAGVKRLIAVERDSRFLPSLELLRDFSGGRLEVHHADALKFDIAGSCSGHVVSKKWDEDPPNMHIIGNLPFNVSIPLLIQWLSMISKRQGPFRFGRSSLTLTFQKEVAERIVADVSDHQRSRPSIMTQNYCEVKWGFVIGSKCFVPQPKVEAVVLKLTPLVKPVVDVDFNTFETVVRLMFRYRRKYVKKGTMLLFPECSEEDQKKLVQELLEESGVAGNMRAQELSVQQFGTVALNYSKYLTTNTNTSKAKSVGLL